MTKQPDNLVSYAIERSLLGAILLNPDRVFDIIAARKTSAGIFAAASHFRLFKIMEQMFQEKAPINPITVSEQSKDDPLGALSAVDRSELEQMIEECPTWTDAEYFLDQLENKYKRREMLGLLDSSKCLVVDESKSAELVRGQIESGFAKLASPADKELTNAQALQQQRDGYERAITHGCAGIRSGFRWFDDAFGGIQKKVLYVISGPPACFKTTLVRNIAEHVAGSQGLRVDFCSLEQSKGQLLASCAARMAGVSISTLQSGRSQAMLDRWNEACEQVQTWPLYITDESQTVSSLWSWARRAKNSGSTMLVIDYLQFVKSDGSYQTEEQRVSQNSDAVRRIALELDIPVICISSEARDTQTGAKIRNSGQVEYDAWVWIRMRMHEDELGNPVGAWVAVKKNRFGPQSPETALSHYMGLMGATPPEKAEPSRTIENQVTPERSESEEAFVP